VQPSQFTILGPRGFADAVPELARYPLEVIRGCLDAAVDELTLTPILARGDAAYLVTPAFVLTVADPAATDEHGTALFGPVRADQVEAMLTLGFTTPRASLTWLTDGDPAVAHHGAHRAVHATHALHNALLAGGQADLLVLLPCLADLINAAADTLSEIGPYCGDHTPLAEQGADLARNLLRIIGQQLLDLRDLCAAHAIDGQPQPQLTKIILAASRTGFTANGYFHTGGADGEGHLSTSGHPTITDAINHLIADATRCHLITDQAELTRTCPATADRDAELAAAALTHRLRWQP
jgi:hypothetical protein